MNKNILAGLASGVALGVVLGLILGRTPGGAWWRIEGWPSPDEWQAFGAIAALFVAVSAVLYARRQVGEARELRREQAQPYVVATPVPELSTGRQACLSIKNYGLTSAHDITVHFPDNSVIVPDAQNSGTWSSTQDLQLAVSTLAPGQETFEWVAIMAAADKNGIRSAEVEVSCKNWLGERQEVTYRISHGPSNIFGKPAALSDVVNELGQISRIMEGWTSSDRRALLMESPRESKKRIFEE